MFNNVYVKTLQKGKDGSTWHNGAVSDAITTDDPYSYETATDSSGAQITATKGDLLFETVRNEFYVWTGSKWKYLSGVGTGLELADNSVTTPKLRNSSVTTAKLDNGAVTTAKINDGAVTTDKLNSSSVTTAKINDGAVTTDKLGNNSVTTVKLADSSVTTAKINDGAVTTDKLNSSSVTTAKLADSSVTTAKINDGAVKTAKLDNGAVTTAKINDGAVTTDKLNSSSVTTAKLADSSVTTAKINDGAVTTDKLSNSSVTTAKLDNGAVTTDKMSLENSTAITSSNDSDLYVVKKAGEETKVITHGTLKTNLLGNSNISGIGASTVTQAIAQLNLIINSNDALTHNSIGRGVKFSAASSSEINWTPISLGSFSNMYIGDYWVINNIAWRIAAFNYFYHIGDGYARYCQTPHVVIVPDTPILTNKSMNNTATTSGGYKGSAMVDTGGGLEEALSIIESAFGADHILSVDQYVSAVVSGGVVTGASWIKSTTNMTASKCFIMSERQVFGSQIVGKENIGTSDKGQFPLFAKFHGQITNNQSYWLRNVHSDTQFAQVTASGVAYWANANDGSGIRPAFCITA